MPDKPDSHGADTEKGFGTGLRAQLQRRRADAPETPTPEVEAVAAAGPVEPGTENVDLLKAELEAAHMREASLRGQLEQQAAAHEGEIGSGNELAHRSAALDERESKLAEFEVELEERERRVRDQREVIEAEHARVADLQAELASEDQREHASLGMLLLLDCEGGFRLELVLEVGNPGVLGF